MKEDSIIKEVRAARKKIEKECAQRGESLGDYLMRIQEEFKDRLVDRSNFPKNNQDLVSSPKTKTEKPKKTHDRK